MTKNFPLLTALLLLPLAACRPAYVAPSGPDTAQLVFRAVAEGRHSEFSAFEPVNEECRGERNLGDLHAYPVMRKTESTATIPAGSTFVFHVFQSHAIYNGNAFCDLTLKFVPQPGQRYDVDVGDCSAVVYRADATSPGGRVLEPSATRAAKQCL